MMSHEEAGAFTGVSISAATVEHTLTNTAKNDQTVSVAYTDPTNANYNAIQDLVDCDSASLSSTAATNNSSFAGTPTTTAVPVASNSYSVTGHHLFSLNDVTLTALTSTPRNRDVKLHDCCLTMEYADTYFTPFCQYLKIAF